MSTLNTFQKIQDKYDFKYYILGSVFFYLRILILDLENMDTLNLWKMQRTMELYLTTNLHF